MADFLYVLTKGGHNVFRGPAIELRALLKNYGIKTLHSNQVAIETLVRLSAEGLRDSRLVNMKSNSNRVVMNRINSKICDLIVNTSNNITKKFCYKDIIYLIQKEVTEVLQFRYKFHLLEAILMITTPLLIANIYGRDIGKFDDCFGFYQNITCKERQLSIRMVQHNANHVSVLLLIISLIRVPLTIHDKLIKTKYYYHNLQNS